MSRDFVHVQNVVALLNELVKRDPAAARALIELRVPCNREVLRHPTIQCWRQEDGQLTVGVLGVLNGLFGTDADGGGPIAAVFETVCDKCGAVVDAKEGDHHDCFETGGTVVCGRLLFFKRRDPKKNRLLAERKNGVDSLNALTGDSTED